MGKINDMIQRLCPDGVEYKKLGELIEIYTGEQFNKVDMDSEGEYPIMNGGIAPSGYSSKYNEEGNTISISQGGESAGYVNWNNSRFWLGAHCYAVHPINNSISNRYLYFFLKSKESYIQSKKHGAGIPGLNKKEIQKLEIPIPPFEIQNEIVKVLDNFTALAAEQEAEQEARRQQYEFYRDRLTGFGKTQNDLLLSSLSPDSKLSRLIRKFCSNNVTWRMLGDIADIHTGSKPNEILSVKTQFQYINAGTSNSGYTREANCVGDTVTTPSRGQGGIGYTGYQKSAFFLGPLCYSIRSIDNNILINKFIYYWLSSNKESILAFRNEGGTPSLNRVDLMKILLPVPPMPVQEEIVRILDRFDKLVNDISEGLPAEIAARQKQYEYYRDRLLNFKRLEA